MKWYSRVLLLLAGSVTASLVVAAQPESPPDPRAAIATKIPGTKAEDLHTSPIPGVYELMRGTDAAYVSSDGKYAIVGDLYDLGSNDNLTEARRRDARLKLLATVPESQMVIFGAKEARHTITVFTDVDCQYCRKLHSQIADYNRLGVRVRYAFFPRTGPNTPSWHKAEAVWCSANRQEALTRAKLGQDVQAKQCQTPVAKTYALGQELGMHGTPGIFTDRGEYITGYVTPAEMLARLKSEGEGATAKN